MLRRKITSFERKEAIEYLLMKNSLEMPINIEKEEVLATMDTTLLEVLDRLHLVGQLF